MTTVPTGNNGSDGRFIQGNQAAKNNIMARKSQQLRVALARAVTVGDVRAVARKMIDMAKAGDVPAAKLVFDRLLGPCLEWDIVERIENLEAALEGRQ